MRIGVIGTGSMGKNHVRVLRNIVDVQEIVISDINQKSLDETAKKFGITKKYLDYNEMLDNEKLDGVIIATQPATHKDIAINVMNRDINLLVEKPIAHNLDDAKQMIETAKKTKKIFTVGHIERFNPIIKEIKKFLNQNLLSNIYLINTHRIGPFPKRLLGKVEGVLIDLAVHDFDIISYISSPIDKITSQIIKNNKQEVYVRTLMELINGVQASSEFSWISPRRVRTIEIYGDSGMILGDYFNQEVWFYENSDFPVISEKHDNFLSAGLINSGKIVKYPIYKQEPLYLELLNFVKAIKSEEEILVKPQDAFKALENVLKIIV